MENKITSIEVIGSGCANCNRLHEYAVQAAKELGLKTAVSYDSDVQKALKMGVVQLPVLAVNGKPVLTGQVSDIKKIKEAIAGAAKCDCRDDDPCSCGGGCGCGC